MSPILFPEGACPECTAGGGRGHERLTDHPLAFPTFRVVRRPSPGATILSPWEGGLSRGSCPRAEGVRRHAISKVSSRDPCGGVCCRSSPDSLRRPRWRDAPSL